MKKFTLILIVFMSITSALAQSLNYYKETTTFQEDGYTYQCDVPPHKLVNLYNKGNKLTDEKMVYKNTGEKIDSFLGEGPKVIIHKDETSRRIDAIVDNAFSKQQAERVQGYSFSITMCLDSETGKALEVYFGFTNFTPYATIPVSVYRKIEVGLKKEISFAPTEIGKQLNYIGLYWRYTPKVRNIIDKDLELNLEPIP